MDNRKLIALLIMFAVGLLVGKIRIDHLDPIAFSHWHGYTCGNVENTTADTRDELPASCEEKIRVFHD